MSIQDQVRKMATLNRSQDKQRQASMFNRAANEVGIKTPDVNHK
jgi:hypothetical protein